MSDRPDLEIVIAKRLMQLCALFGREFTDDLAEAWGMALEGLDPRQVDSAMKQLAQQQERRGMPIPADVFALVQGTTEDAALAAWEEARGMIERVNNRVGEWGSIPGLQDAINTCDERGWSTLEAMGGLGKVARRVAMDGSEWIRKEFLDHYRQKARQERREELPKLEGGSVNVGRIGEA